MKKLFLLIPALVLSLAINADVINIDNTTPNAVQAALNSAASGDIIEMAAGTYEESGNYLAFTGKELTVRAAAGAEVIIRTVCPVRLKEGAKAEFINVKFDCSTIGSYDYVIVAADDTENKRVVLNGCEFYGWTKEKAMIEATSSRRLDAITIDNCYFHDCMKSVVFVENTGYNDLSITNSTFANIATSANFSAGVIDSRATSGSILVDHCTFYNVQAMNTDYAAIGKVSLASGATVSNCIFAMPESIGGVRTIRDKVAANNCLVFNYTQDSGYGMQSNVTKTGCFIADPLFADAANGDFSLAGDWTTMNLSPARGAATDGSDLGDPRWYSAEVLPETNFVSPYAFVGEKALISGNIWYNSDDAYLYYNDKSVCGTATWKIHATRACAVKATLNMTNGSSSGHIFRIELLDANGNQVAQVAEPAQSSHDGDIDLPNPLSIPAAGDYTVILHNDQSWSSAKINSITLAYVGGAIVTVPAEELVGAEAVLVNNGSLKVSKQENGDLKYGDNGTPLGEYVYWNINATKRGDMKVTLNVVPPTSGSASTHNFLVELYSDLSGEPIASAAEVAATSGTGARVLANSINIPAVGNYIVKLTNQTQWSSAILHSIQFEYLGGATMNIPADELIGEEAVLVDNGNLKVSKLENGDLKYGDNGSPLGEYVYWNINATKYGRMDVTLNVVPPTSGSASGHQFLVELYSDLNGEPIVSTAEAASTSATGTIALPALNIPAAGNYIVKLTNQKQWSSAILHSIEFAYAGGEVANVPGQILGADAMLLKEDGGTLKMYHAANGDITYNDNGTPTTEYALWNIHADAACELAVELNIATSGHILTVELYDGTTLLGSAAETEATKWDGGNIALEDHLNIPAAGNYTIKVINSQQWSHGALHGITFTEIVPPTVVVLDEMAEDNNAWISYKDGDAVNVQLTRTIVAGMYNTICLPFDVDGTQTKAIFGSDVELYTLGTTAYENEVLTLNVDPASDIYHGTPYLIKTSADVVNPQFEGVQILSEVPANTSSTYVDFIGNFIKSEVPAGENNLFLGPNDLLYFSQTATPIKGMRAYFRVNVPSAANAVKRARIVAQGQVVTAIDLVGAESKSFKTIENGQLIITIDGVRYNVMGAKIQ